jgi:hypothetical protein
MKTHAKYLLLAATCFAFAGIARAQYVTISDDTGSWSGSTITFNAAGANYSTQGEEITNAIAIQSVTYTFLSTSINGLGASLSAALVQLGGGGSYSTIASLGTINIPNVNTWTGTLTYGQTTAYTYQGSLNLSFTDTSNLNPSNTYAVLLTNTGNTGTSFGLGYINLPLTGPGTSDLVGAGYNYGTGIYAAPGSNWTFSDVTFVPGGNTIPSPEPATLAAWAGVILVAGLVFFRLRQRQGAEAIPAFTTIA